MFDAETLSGADALLEAQKIAFGPIIFQTSRLLREWGVFELLQNHKEGLGVDEIAAACNLTVYAAKVLCESGYSMRALAFENERYYLTPVGYFLLNDEMTRVNMDYNHDVNYQGLFYLDEALQKGEASGLHHTFFHEKTIYPVLTKLPQKAKEAWFAFDHFYSDAAFESLVKLMSQKAITSLLDVGGNTGKWAIALTKASPKTTVTILDHQEQIDAALANAAEHGVLDRVKSEPLNLLDHSIDFPSGVDAVWMSQFLDCFAPKDIINLLKRAKKALNATGRVYIVEPFWDRQSHEIGAFCLINTSPYFTALANGESKMYRASEMEAYAVEAGLKLEEEINGLGFGHTMMVLKA